MPTFVTRSSQQTYAKAAGGILPKIISPTGKLCVNYTLLKEIALHPIVRLGIELIIGIISKSQWHININENSPHYEKFSPDELESIRLSLQNNLDEFRDDILNLALRNQIIYGWQAFERILKWDCDQERYVVKELKPLLQEFTQILVNDAGDYAGIRNIPPTDGKMVDIPASELILFNIDVIGQNWYGTPLLLSAVEPYLESKKVQGYNNSFLDRISQVSGIIKFPVGKETIDGIEVDNFDIARDVAAGLSENSVVIVPNTSHRERDLTTPESPAWEFEPIPLQNLSVGGIFKENKDHLESLLINALGLPARIVLDGQFGSYSSNQTYRDAAYDILQTRQNRIIKVLNKQFIDPLLSINYDAPGLLAIYAAPLDDDSLQNIFRLYPQLKDDPQVDQAALKERLGIPDTDKDDKFIDVESSEPTITPKPEMDGLWLNVGQLAQKLNMSTTSIRSKMKRFHAIDPDFNGIWKGPDNRLRVNSNFVKEVFDLPFDTNWEDKSLFQ
jgi:hypothetical protein